MKASRIVITGMLAGALACGLCACGSQGDAPAEEPAAAETEAQAEPKAEEDKEASAEDADAQADKDEDAAESGGGVRVQSTRDDSAETSDEASEETSETNAEDMASALGEPAPVKVSANGEVSEEDARKLYGEKLKELVERYGMGLGSEGYWEGLAVAQAIDFDLDGKDELYVAYGSREDPDMYSIDPTAPYYYQEVYGIENGEVKSLFWTGGMIIGSPECEALVVSYEGRPYVSSGFAGGARDYVYTGLDDQGALVTHNLSCKGASDATIDGMTVSWDEFAAGTDNAETIVKIVLDRLGGFPSTDVDPMTKGIRNSLGEFGVDWQDL